MMGAIGEVVDDGFINSKGIALLGAGTSGYVELFSTMGSTHWTRDVRHHIGLLASEGPFS